VAFCESVAVTNKNRLALCSKDFVDNFLCSDSGKNVLSVPGSSIWGHGIFFNQKQKATSGNSMQRDQKSNSIFEVVAQLLFRRDGIDLSLHMLVNTHYIIAFQCILKW